MEWDISAYDKMLSFQVAISQNVEIPLIHNKHILQAHSVLDIGCGNGCFTVILADKYPNKKFVAIDNNCDLISFAQKYNSRENITYVNAGYSDFGSNDSFDVVIARLVVHIISDRTEFFRWVHSKLWHHGAFFIIDADDDNFSIYPKPPIFCSLDEQTNEKINRVGARNTKTVIKDELLSCDFREERFFTFSPNSIMVDKSIFFRYMVYIMKIEKGENVPLEAYKELFEWYDNDGSFVQYGMYFGLYLKEENIHED